MKMMIQYVGILKQILQLDYGPMFSPIMLFCCNWVKNGIRSRGKPTYKCDDANFLLANFWHLLDKFDEPFFPFTSLVVFFWSDPKTPWALVEVCPS
jgi:hypothetical protein